MIKEIYSDHAPLPNGHYSQAVEHNGTLYVSCQLGFVGKEKIIPKDFKEEAAQCFNNLHEIIKAGGGNINSILRVTIYVSDIALWPDVNEIYARAMGAHKPARSVVPVSVLHCGARIGMEAIAAIGKGLGCKSPIHSVEPS